VPEFQELITDAVSHLWACRMSADMMNLTDDDLYDRLERIISAADFIDISEGAQTIFIRGGWPRPVACAAGVRASAYPEQVSGLAEPGDEGVDVRLLVVDVEAGPCRGGHA
jgi:hypothetical protein